MDQGSKIQIRNEVDRFGFSNIIAKKLKYKNVPRSFANWMHGWFWFDPEDKNINNKLDLILGYPKDFNYNVPTVVSNNTFKIALENKGFSYVYSGGLPFIYTQENTTIKKLNSLLVIVPHSLSYYEFSELDFKNISNFFENIFKI